MMGDGSWGGQAHWHMMGQSGTSGLWLLVVVLFLLLAAVSAALVWVLRATGPRRGNQLPAGDTSSAERILEDRLARGEIDEDTYLRTRALLGKD
jgi:putative membrane protein